MSEVEDNLTVGPMWKRGKFRWADWADLTLNGGYITVRDLAIAGHISKHHIHTRRHR